MPKQYEGVCIDGPLAGQYLSRINPVYSAIVKTTNKEPSVPDREGESYANDTFTIEAERYLHEYFCYKEPGQPIFQIGFWYLKKDGVSTAISRLFAFYAEHAEAVLKEQQDE